MRHSTPAKVLAASILLTVAAVYFTSCATSHSSTSSGAANPGSGGSGTVVHYAAGIGGAGQTSAARFLYAMQVPGGVPIATKINSVGTLSGAQQNFTTGLNASNPSNAAIDPSGTFLYQAAQPGIYPYTIDRTSGSITQMGNTPFTATQNFDTIAVDQLGKSVYAYGGGQVFAFTIQAGTGQLTPVMGSPFGASPPTPTFGPGNRMAIDQTNKFLYVSTSGGIMGLQHRPG